MKNTLLELEKELFKFNNPTALSIPSELLELIENPPDPFCYWDLSEEERDELWYSSSFGCQCKKCLEKELDCDAYENSFYPETYFNSAFIN